MNLIQQFVNNKNHFNGVNKKSYITVHETGNKGFGANAKSHANFIKNSSVTWHYTVDDKMVIQHFSDDVQCWHCGDGRGNGNLNSIGIEMCINSDGDMNKTISNTIELIQMLMKKYSIPFNNVVQHNFWSGKDCPKYIRQGIPINWLQFKNKITDSKPVTPPTQTNFLYKVQVGAFRNKTNAEYLKNKLINQGYKDTFITLNNNLYKVQVGAFSIKNNADKLLLKLKSLGYFDTFITK